MMLPYPDNQLIDATTTFMSFPIKTSQGFRFIGIAGSILFVLALVLLAKGLRKYHVRTILLVIGLFTFSPKYLLAFYQDTLASGINAVTYDGEGTCQFEEKSEALLEGTCSIVLRNRSKEPVTFALEFINSNDLEDGIRMQTLMNTNGPYQITIDAKQERRVNLTELLDVSDIPQRITNGSSNRVHIRLIEPGKSRNL
ncbi:hypothetical protein NCCP2222_35010 [Sporosarcina sp. NCCP-2222]|uniref:hypothetical protein n=1 Tax=Sporosarcina sp. NCCP-2222 TaxID=2935073 RepID=UPI002089D93D|nr:hypothetical protein [Sporosarcina sp. NCCP-2222]GKV57554.1 hypothetical protein NCCP2222_35010 [Sporosarcina sp. NCCP-2222]